MTSEAKTTIPHKACGTPGECRKAQVCLDGWRCAAEASVTPTTMKPTENEDRRSQEWALKIALMGALFRDDGQMIGYADRMIAAIKRLGWRPPDSGNP